MIAKPILKNLRFSAMRSKNKEQRILMTECLARAKDTMRQRRLLREPGKQDNLYKRMNRLSAQIVLMDKYMALMKEYRTMHKKRFPQGPAF